MHIEYIIDLEAEAVTTGEVLQPTFEKGDEVREDISAVNGIVNEMEAIAKEEIISEEAIVEGEIFVTASMQINTKQSECTVLSGIRLLVCNYSLCNVSVPYFIALRSSEDDVSNLNYKSTLSK